MDDNEIVKIIKSTIPMKIDFNDPNVLVSTYSGNVTIAGLFDIGVSEIYFTFNDKQYHVKKDDEVGADVLEYMKTKVVRSGIEIHFF